MDFCPRTSHQSGTWTRAEPYTCSEPVLSNSVKKNGMASHWKPQSELPYQYVRATRFPSTVDVQTPAQWQQLQSAASTHQSQAHGVQHVDTTYLSTVPSHSVEPLKTVTTTSSDDTTAWLRQLGPLKFVGNVNLPVEVVGGQQNNMALEPAQMPGVMTQDGEMAPRVYSMPSMPAAPMSLSTGTFGGAPPPSQASGRQYSKEDHLKMIMLHGEMLAKYRELTSQAENIEKMMMMQSEHHSVEKTENKQGSIWGEELKALEDFVGDLVLPDDAVDKLEAIPGILDLAREMGFPECLLLK
ncbi:uncharacterized protein LOC134454923 [Engraulis encrasicolus]|uniref:uncharacterized protein LOC134454923 n=1 Tax=Engraulis encrasicolus TaxID=184585 RepID=UPI002FD0AB30